MERLYSEDSYLDKFKAEVTGVAPCQNGWEISLSSSSFYPESGGQPADQGWINDVRVVNVLDTSEGPLHIVAAENLSVGQDVQCRIDWDRRFDFMQHHTGQHILSQAFLETSGAETVSFHLSCDSATIDLSVESLSEEKIQEAETRANSAVTKNLKISVYQINSEKQKDLPIRKPSPRQGSVRIVEIEKWDYSPCGGTHCRFTGEVGLIKVTRQERVRQQLRIHFSCGDRSLRDYQKKTELVTSIGQLLSCGDDDLFENLQKEMENSSQQAKKYQKLQEAIISLTSEKIKHSVQDINGIKTVIQVVENIELKNLNKLATKLLQQKTADIVLLAAEEPRPGVLFARISEKSLPDLRTILKATQELFGGRGGGSPDRVHAGGTDSSGLRPTLEKASTLIKQHLSG
jgi:alanyl-tRNA synthetase